MAFKLCWASESPGGPEPRALGPALPECLIHVIWMRITFLTSSLAVLRLLVQSPTLRTVGAEYLYAFQILSCTTVFKVKVMPFLLKAQSRQTCTCHFAQQKRSYFWY